MARPPQALESHIQADIRLALGTRPDLRLFRNAKGMAWFSDRVKQVGRTVTMENARKSPAGLLVPGSSDLIGMRRVVITPEMVGQTVAVFTALEVKRPGETHPQDQVDFVDFVNEFGGRAGFVHSVDEAVRAVSDKP